jgi:hypothetical protein
VSEVVEEEKWFRWPADKMLVIVLGGSRVCESA